MSFSAKFTALLARCAIKTQIQDKLLTQLEKKISAAQREIEALNGQEQTVKGALQVLTPKGEMSRGGLLLIHRKQASLRRCIVDLDVKRVQKRTELRGYTEEKAKLSNIRQTLLRQADKYQHLQTRERITQRLIAIRQEETEVEEIIAWHR